MLEEIYRRQSIRRYSQKPIEQAKLKEILRAGMNGPTARNTQSWRFIVIRNRKALDEMTTLQPYTGMMKQAPCAILVLGDRSVSQPDAYLYCDASAAIENMLIEAVYQGLGSCWCAIGPKEERIQNFRKYYQLEDNLLPIAVIAFGYGEEYKEKKDRYDPDKIQYYD